jgi:uncharacterized protein (TIGR02265 family)
MEKVVFEQTIEGLFVRALGPRLTPPLRARLKAVGIDIDARLLPAYPFATWMKGLELVARELYPDRTIDDAMFQIGTDFLNGYRETFLGRAVLGMIRALGPNRTLKRATQNFRSGNNYTESRVVELSPTCCELWMNEVGPWPTFTAGLVHAALSNAGVEPDITVQSFDGHAATFRCSWALKGPA